MSSTWTFKSNNIVIKSNPSDMCNFFLFFYTIIFIELFFYREFSMIFMECCTLKLTINDIISNDNTNQRVRLKWIFFSTCNVRHKEQNYLVRHSILTLLNVIHVESNQWKTIVIDRSVMNSNRMNEVQKKLRQINFNEWVQDLCVVSKNEWMMLIFIFKIRYFWS